MNNEVILKEGKVLIGVSNLVVSENDNNIYINNASYIQDSVVGSLAVYDKDGASSLKGSGVKCVWNEATYTLEVENIKTDCLDTKIVKSKSVDTFSVNVDTIECTNYASFNKLAVDKWLGFHSKSNPGLQPFKIQTVINKENNKETLIFLSNDISKEVKSSVLLSLDDTRLTLMGTTSIVERTIETSIGNPGDLKGDIAVDENFFYYCVKDFNGTTPIWKRCSLLEW